MESSPWFFKRLGMIFSWNVSTISRSVWQGLRDSGAFFDVEKSLDRIHWATAEIRRFLEREEVRARELGVAIQRNRSAYKSNVPLENELRDRVTHFDPRSLLEEAR